jgi:hypothetical protein
MSRVTGDLKNVPCGGASLQKSGGAVHEGYDKKDGVPTKEGQGGATAPPQGGSNQGTYKGTSGGGS